MSNQPERLLTIARGEVGYLEKRTESQLDSMTANAGQANFTKYGTWYGWNGVSWCHIFVSWVAAQADCADIIPKTASCYEGRDWFTARKRFFKRTAGYTPVAGDVVYFSSSTYPSGGAHVGYVTACFGGRVYTIEGNTSAASGVIPNGGGVAAKSYEVGNDRIYGYGHPAYEQLEQEDDEMLTYEQFESYMARYEKERAAEPVSAFAKDAWAALTTAGVTDGTMPRAPLTREQYAVMEQRKK